jgi:hypothetical protein
MELSVQPSDVTCHLMVVHGTPMWQCHRTGIAKVYTRYVTVMSSVSCMLCIELIHMFLNKFLGLNYCILMKGLEFLLVSHLSLHLISNFSILSTISLY